MDARSQETQLVQSSQARADDLGFLRMLLADFLDDLEAFPLHPLQANDQKILEARRGSNFLRRTPSPRSPLGVLGLKTSS